MKIKSFVVSGILGIVLAGAVLTGCHKDSTAPPAATSNDYTSAEDESNASEAMNDTKTVSDAAAQGKSQEYRPEKNIKAIYSQNCNVTWAKDTGNGMDTMYINFGVNPVKCNDGRWRQGEIIVYWPGKDGSLLQTYFDSGSVISMTFKNYEAGNSQVNMIGVVGTRSWTNIGNNALNEQNWSFNANLTLTYYGDNNKTATWISKRTNTLVEVNGVYYYEITGEAYGTDRNGVGYTLTIETPLYVTALPWWLGGCAWIESGTISVNLTNVANTLNINFGNLGTCDDVATATIGNNTYTYYMW